MHTNTWYNYPTLTLCAWKKGVWCPWCWWYPNPIQQWSKPCFFEIDREDQAVVKEILGQTIIGYYKLPQCPVSFWWKQKMGPGCFTIGCFSKVRNQYFYLGEQILDEIPFAANFVPKLHANCISQLVLGGLLEVRMKIELTSIINRVPKMT